MRFTIDRSALAGLMSRGGSLKARATTIPILSNVRLVAEAGCLSVSTTDLDLQAVAYAEAEVETPGSITVNAKALADFVGHLPTGVSKVTIEPDKSVGSLIVKAGRSKARLATLPAEDFPDLTVISEKSAIARFQVAGADIKTLFGRTEAAISTEETRYYLNGTFLHVADGQLRAVSTNGHILIRTAVALPEGAGRFHKDAAQRFPGVIVPKATVAAVLNLFAKEEAVRVIVSGTGIGFEAGASRIVSKLIDGTFPDIDRVIPTDNPHRIKLDRSSCLSALNLVEVFHTRDSGNLLECGVDEEGLAMASGAAGGEGDGFAVAMADFEGEVPRFGVSSCYLRNVLGAFSADLVTLALAAPGSPIRVTAEGEAHVLGVIMPMRVGFSRLDRMGVRA